MWSGGLDSTALMYKALTETGAYVHSHFIKLVEQHSRREVFESRAIGRLLPSLQEIRQFEFSSTMVDLTGMGNPFQSEDLCLLWASNIVNNLPTQTVEVWEGSNWNDFQKPAVIERAGRRTLQSGFDYFFNNRFHKDVTIETPLKDMTKEEVWRYLPPAYRTLTSSCRSPLSTGRRCRRCEPCTYLNEIERKNLAE